MESVLDLLLGTWPSASVPKMRLGKMRIGGKSIYWPHVTKKSKNEIKRFSEDGSW